MDYELEPTFRNMYFGAEIRFDAIGRLFKAIAAKMTARPARIAETVAASI